MKNAKAFVPICVMVLLIIPGLLGCSPSGGGEITAPTGLVAVASPSATEISLSWGGTLAGGATFLVFRGTAPGAESQTPIGWSATTSYTDADPTLQSSTPYYYVVVMATTSAQSGYSNEAWACTVDAGSVGVTIQ